MTRYDRRPWGPNWHPAEVTLWLGADPTTPSPRREDLRRAEMRRRRRLTCGLIRNDIGADTIPSPRLLRPLDSRACFKLTCRALHLTFFLYEEEGVSATRGMLEPAQSTGWPISNSPNQCTGQSNANLGTTETHWKSPEVRSTSQDALVTFVRTNNDELEAWNIEIMQKPNGDQVPVAADFKLLGSGCYKSPCATVCGETANATNTCCVIQGLRRAVGENTRTGMVISTVVDFFLPELLLVAEILTEEQDLVRQYHSGIDLVEITVQAGECRSGDSHVPVASALAQPRGDYILGWLLGSLAHGGGGVGWNPHLQSRS
ncbi:hypothetical protein BJY52DRAFT_1418104 [Lactarius psammicola]|nr:hypothetical protein BJY52DRAFT_1418104 [Lactarius psammicola]